MDAIDPQRGLKQALEALEPRELEALRGRAAEAVSRGEGTRPAIDPLPYLPSAEDLDSITRAASQWGRFFHAAYLDLRGGQEAARKAIPAQALWEGALFDPAFNLAPYAKDTALGVVRLDLVKDESLGWRLIGAETGPIRGLGYALETRIAHGKAFGAALDRSRLVRVAPFFQGLKELWRGLALRNRDEPAVMIWSEGPESPDYAEQVYLCRYFGYPLVESRDLTVRSGRVYLKMLGGLRRVDVLVRAVRDRAMDPLMGNPPPESGVAGLAQAIRLGEVIVTAAPGADILGHPAMLSLSARYAAALGQEAPEAAYDPRPRHPERAPFRSLGAWEDRPMAVSVFAAKLGADWVAMPGGLCRPLQLLGDSAIIDDGLRKDLWILSDESVPFVSLLPQRGHPSPITRAADLPSRVADDLFWLGRHSERAWADLRLLSKWLEVLQEAGSGESARRGGLVASCAEKLGSGRPRDARALSAAEWSLWSRLGEMERVAARVRDRFSLETHRVIDDLAALGRKGAAATGAEEVKGLLEGASRLLAAFNGYANEHMTRGAPWRFLDMGKRLERAQLLTLAVSHYCAATSDADELSVLLELFDSLVTYKARYYFMPETGPLLDLLLLDESNPRSLAFQAVQLLEHLESLPYSQEEAYRDEGERVALRLLSSIRTVEAPALAAGAGEANSLLGVFAKETLRSLGDLSEAIQRRYLVKLEPLQRMVETGSGEAR
jgi:uncharacterized alpha-E superfamily protein/uncharacterized circularly permuted ATP-grasp superfamily protein